MREAAQETVAFLRGRNGASAAVAYAVASVAVDFRVREAVGATFASYGDAKPQRHLAYGCLARISAAPCAAGGYAAPRNFHFAGLSDARSQKRYFCRSGPGHSAFLEVSSKLEFTYDRWVVSRCAD